MKSAYNRLTDISYGEEADAVSTLIVDSAALSRNMEKLRRFTSAQIIAVVKGNGYGLGLVP